jgi:hypothetical protein
MLILNLRLLAVLSLQPYWGFPSALACVLLLQLAMFALDYVALDHVALTTSDGWHTCGLDVGNAKQHLQGIDKNRQREREKGK